MDAFLYVGGVEGRECVAGVMLDDDGELFNNPPAKFSYVDQGGPRDSGLDGAGTGRTGYGLPIFRRVF
jgi:hypothetical protein